MAYKSLGEKLAASKKKRRSYAKIGVTPSKSAQYAEGSKVAAVMRKITGQTKTQQAKKIRKQQGKK